jgi:hypothetical protein
LEILIWSEHPLNTCLIQSLNALDQCISSGKAQPVFLRVLQCLSVLGEDLQISFQPSSSASLGISHATMGSHPELQNPYTSREANCGA